jgi:Na+:H+ antiporter, NhaA family
MKQRINLFLEFSVPMVSGVLIAIMWANLAPAGYHEFLKQPLVGGLSFHAITNELFMALFFGVAAVEVTQSCLPGGGLNPPSRAVNPLLGTLGGVLGPVAVYLGLNALMGGLNCATGGASPPPPTLPWPGWLPAPSSGRLIRRSPICCSWQWPTMRSGWPSLPSSIPITPFR